MFDKFFVGSENGDVPEKKKEEKERFLDIHIYLTSALSKKDFRAVGLQVNKTVAAQFSSLLFFRFDSLINKLVPSIAVFHK